MWLVAVLSNVRPSEGGGENQNQQQPERSSSSSGKTHRQLGASANIQLSEVPVQQEWEDERIQSGRDWMRFSSPGASIRRSPGITTFH